MSKRTAAGAGVDGRADSDKVARRTSDEGLAHATWMAPRQEMESRIADVLLSDPEWSKGATAFLTPARMTTNGMPVIDAYEWPPQRAWFRHVLATWEMRRVVEHRRLDAITATPMSDSEAMRQGFIENGTNSAHVLSRALATLCGKGRFDFAPTVGNKRYKWNPSWPSETTRRFIERWCSDADITQLVQRAAEYRAAQLAEAAAERAERDATFCSRMREAVVSQSEMRLIVWPSSPSRRFAGTMRIVGFRRRKIEPAAMTAVPEADRWMGGAHRVFGVITLSRGTMADFIAEFAAPGSIEIDAGSGRFVHVAGRKVPYGPAGKKLVVCPRNAHNTCFAARLPPPTPMRGASLATMAFRTASSIQHPVAALKLLPAPIISALFAFNWHYPFDLGDYRDRHELLANAAEETPEYNNLLE